MLGRMEDASEDSQPEEQHGFRKQKTIDEHLLTANLSLQKTLAANIPLWIISLDLPKALDKVNWEALRAVLMQHGVSNIWCRFYNAVIMVNPGRCANTLLILVILASVQV